LELTWNKSWWWDLTFNASGSFHSLPSSVTESCVLTLLCIFKEPKYYGTCKQTQAEWTKLEKQTNGFFIAQRKYFFITKNLNKLDFCFSTRSSKKIDRWSAQVADLFIFNLIALLFWQFSMCIRGLACLQSYLIILFHYKNKTKIENWTFWYKKCLVSFWYVYFLWVPKLIFSKFCFFSI
jgi:hypothetical protein